ncbi:MAG: DsbA family protein [Anaerolineae bacterium]
MAAGRLHQIQEEYGGKIELVYKTYPLGPTKDEITRMFGTPERAKAKILNHWRATKRLPGSEPINPDLMASRPFPYPYSMPPLRAVKAAEFQGGMTAHPRMYDRLQRAHLVEARDVADPEVLFDCARDIGLDMARFRADFENEASRTAVMADLSDAHALGISGTPTVVFNEKWVLSGAVPIELYRQVIDDLLAGRDPAAG